MAKLRRVGLPVNAGEAVVFETLQRELPEDYLILANVNLYQRQFLPETDAVVIHPNALFSLEIKDLHGKLEWAGPGSDWLHNGHPIANPYEQAALAAKKLVKYLRYQRAREIFDDVRVASSVSVQAVLVVVDSKTDIVGVAKVSDVALRHLSELPKYLTTSRDQFRRMNFRPQEIERISEVLGLKMGTTVKLDPPKPLPPVEPSAAQPSPDRPPIPKPQTPAPPASRKPTPALKCPNCGRNNSPRSKFCGQCGTVLTQDAKPVPAPLEKRKAVAAPPATITHQKTDEPMGESAQPRASALQPPQTLVQQAELTEAAASTPQSTEVSQPVASSPQQVEQPQPAVEPQPPESNQTNLPTSQPVEPIPPSPVVLQTCSQCGRENKPTARFCVQCGNALQSPPASVDAAPPVQQPQVRKVCSKCQRENNLTARFCRQCGTKLE